MNGPRGNYQVGQAAGVPVNKSIAGQASSTQSLKAVSFRALKLLLTSPEQTPAIAGVQSAYLLCPAGKGKGKGKGKPVLWSSCLNGGAS